MDGGSQRHVMDAAEGVRARTNWAIVHAPRIWHVVQGRGIRPVPWETTVALIINVSRRIKQARIKDDCVGSAVRNLRWWLVRQNLPIVARVDVRLLVARRLVISQLPVSHSHCVGRGRRHTIEVVAGRLVEVVGDSGYLRAASGGC